MGILTWLLGGAVALLACRFVPLGRPASLLPEAVCGLGFAVAGGLLATRLDFGGWNAAEPRAAFFCAAVACSGIALARAAGVLLSPRMPARKLR